MQLIFIFGAVLHMSDQSHPRSLRSYKMGVCPNNISEDYFENRPITSGLDQINVNTPFSSSSRANHIGPKTSVKIGAF